MPVIFPGFSWYNMHDGASTSPLTGVLVAGVSSLTPGAGMTFDRLLTLLRTDSAYVNVHTTAHPGGEIRGTVVAQ